MTVLEPERAAQCRNVSDEKKSEVNMYDSICRYMYGYMYDMRATVRHSD